MSSLLKEKVERLPRRPGIYFFKNENNEYIYIGKARSLRERVRSYFLPAPDFKVQHILSETADIDYIITDSEKEAAFLENNLIQKHQPKFNLRLKDDKSFPYLKIAIQEKFPPIAFCRRVEKDGSRYFGPFAPAHQAKKTIYLLSKFFGLRNCDEPIPGKRQRPCLNHDLKLCSAPCVHCISEEEYRQNVENALLFLEGKTEKLIKVLKQKMRQAAENLEFEQAARWRDCLLAMEQLREKPKMTTPSEENVDIFGLARDEKQAAFHVFMMRKGKVTEIKESLLDEEAEIPREKILAKFLMSFYRKEQDFPDKILLPLKLSEEDVEKIRYSYRKMCNLKLLIPKKAEEKKMVDLACSNAELLLQKKGIVFSAEEEIQRIFELKKIPQRIEGFDISNIGGEETVASLVVFEEGFPKKEEYRKYKIRTVKGPNDIASLEEVLERRYTRVLEEKKPLPDLILIDGGKGQLNAALKSLEKLGLKRVPVISLAKKEEILFAPARKEGVRLERTSPALKLFQRIRDEAHRFAITFHRQRRKKKSFLSELDGIEGIGKKRKKALLEKYKDIETIKRASPEELASIVGRKAAQALHQTLRGDKLISTKAWEGR